MTLAAPRCTKCGGGMVISRIQHKWAPGLYVVRWFCPHHDETLDSTERLKDQEWTGVVELQPEELEAFR